MQLKDFTTKITALTKAVRYYIADTSSDIKYSDLEQLASWLSGFRMMMIDSARTLTSTTSAQAIFGAANDAMSLPTGKYVFDGLIVLNTMSATSGNAQFQLLGGGTATVGKVLYHSVGVDGAVNTAATQTGSTSNASNSPASISTAGTGTGLTMNLKGSFEVTATGTIIPSIALVTANAAVVAVGSFFRVQRVGGVSFVASEDVA